MSTVLENPPMASEKGMQNRLNQFLAWLELFRQVNPDIASQQIALVVHVAMKPGQTMLELSRKIGMSQSSLTRNFSALSKWSGINRPGYDLLEGEREGRERRVYLTAKGQRLVDTFNRL